MAQAGRDAVGQPWCLQALGWQAEAGWCSSHGSAAPGAALLLPLAPPGWLGHCGRTGGSAKGPHSDRTGLAVSTSAALRRIGRRVQIWDGDVGHWQELCGARGCAAANGHPEDVWV